MSVDGQQLVKTDQLRVSTRMPHFQKSKNNLRIFDILKSGHPNRDPINTSNLREYENMFDGNPKTYWHGYIPATSNNTVKERVEKIKEIF